MLGDFDLLVLPSYNEGQPIVVLEAMTAGVPTVGTSVGGMSQLIHDPLMTDTGVTLDSCGVLVNPADIATGMADALQTVLADLDTYERLTRNARGRVEHFFQLHEAMRQYNTLYRRLGGLPPLIEHADADLRREAAPIPGVVPSLDAPTLHMPALSLSAAPALSTAPEEAEVVEVVAWARRGGGWSLPRGPVAQALGAGVALNEGQRRLVTGFSRSGRRVALALAPAGTAKTTAMAVFATAWRAAGGRVYAFGPSARIAAELGSAIDASPHTLHQLTRAVAQGHADQAFPFRRGDVLVIDKAAMAGIHTLHTVIAYALELGADVRLLENEQQLGAAEAGDAIRLIAQDVGATRLTEVVRFHDRAQAAASIQIREADPAGLGYYVGRGWVHGGSIETMREAALAAWQADLDAGLDTLLILPTDKDVVRLNREARTHRMVHGHVDRSRHVFLRDRSAASAGDTVVTLANDRRLVVFGGRDFVKNGDTWTVAAITDKGGLRLRHRGHRGTAELPAGYVGEHVQLGYAATVHRVHDMTVNDTAHTLVPARMTRELLYPGMTRSRGANHLYVITHEHADDGDRKTPPVQAAQEVLAAVIGRSHAAGPQTTGPHPLPATPRPHSGSSRNGTASPGTSRPSPSPASNPVRRTGSNPMGPEPAAPGPA
jgi:hypothetical protein